LSGEIKLSESTTNDEGVVLLPVDGRSGSKRGVSIANDVNFLDVITLAERLHRQFLDVIQLELDRLGVRDINSVRALILLNIDEAEMTASELMWRGCYLGSNVSYNLKKLTETGYVDQTRSTHDRRVVMIRNSGKGLELCEKLKAMNARHLEAMSKANVKLEDLETCRRTLASLQKFWSRTIHLTPNDSERFVA
jgi:DNA-binding MarR family transcriptional regulator